MVNFCQKCPKKMLCKGSTATFIHAPAGNRTMPSVLSGAIQQIAPGPQRG